MDKNYGISAGIAVIVVLIFVFAFIYTFNGRSTNIGSTNSLGNLIPTQLEVPKEKEARETYIPKCSTIEYSELSQRPYLYKEKNFTFTGKVIKILPGENSNFDLLVDVTLTNNSNSNQTSNTTNNTTDSSQVSSSNLLYISYKYYDVTDADSYLDTTVTVYGSAEGNADYTYDSGEKVSLPRLEAMYIDVK